ncbi:MAG: GumC family protein [Gammaproteobacteria bacterium]
MTDEYSVHGNRNRKPGASGRPEDADPSGMDWDLPEPAGDTAEQSEAHEEPASAPPTHTEIEPVRRGADGFPLLGSLPPKPAENDDGDDDGGFPFPGMGEEEAPETKGSGLDFVRLLKGIWSRRIMVAAIGTITTLLFGALAFTLVEKTWIANATLINRTTQDEFQIGKFGKPFKPQNYDLKTMIDTLLLPSVLQETLRRSGVEMQPRKLVKHIDVTLGKESRIFQVKIEWTDPVMAAKVANHLVDVFIERNRDIRRADAEETLLYYSGQLESAQQKARQTNDELDSFVRDYKITDLDTEINVLVSELTNQDGKLKALEAEVTAMRQDITRLDKAIEAEPEMIVQSSYYVNPLAKNLTDLEWELEQARGRYTDENPKVKDLKSRIAKIKALIDKGTDAAPSNTYAHNPVREELTVRRYATISDLKVKEAKLKALAKLVPDIRQKLDTLTSKKQEYDQLRAKVGNNQTLTDNLRNRVEEARVIMMRNASDFDIVERATPPDEGEPSGRKLIVMAGIVLGGGGGVFLALLLEFLDIRIRTRRETVDLAEGELTFEFQHVPDDQQIIIDAHSPGEAVASIFRRMVIDMEGTLEEGSWQSLAVISLEGGAGRSVIATNMAQTIALRESEVILVDADLRAETGERPGAYYEIASEGPGLAEILDGSSTPDEALRATETRGARLIPTGRDGAPASGDLHALGGRSMADLIDRLKSFPGHVIYDLPPLDAQQTVVEAVRRIGNALMVVRSGQSAKPGIRTLITRLKELGVQVRVGIITDVPYELTQEAPVYDRPVKAKKDKKKKKKKPSEGERQEPKLA